MQLVPSICPKCSTPLPVPYQERGLSKWCNTCLYPCIPIVPVGSTITSSGTYLTYTSFKSLIADPSDRKPVETLIKENFNFELAGEGREETLIINEHGQAIDPVWLHRKIQDNEILRGQLYNIAMDLWRS